LLFFTVNLLERKQTLLTDNIDLLRDSASRVRRLYPFHIDAWVVLPDHLHCVWTLPTDTDEFPLRWRLIKLFFSRGLPKSERMSATRRKRKERGDLAEALLGAYDYNRIGLCETYRLLPR